MKLFLSFFLGLFLFGLQSQGQALTPSENVKTIKTQGLLVIVLHSNSILINKLNEKGFAKEAKNEAQIQLEKNKRVVKAFKENYSFSHIAFCHIKDLEKVVQEKRIEYLKSDINTPFRNEKIFNNSSLYFCDPENIFMEHVEQGTLYKGMSILDEDYINLNKPFPYFIRKHEGLFFMRRSEEEMVMILEKKLYKYYEKVSG